MTAATADLRPAPGAAPSRRRAGAEPAGEIVTSPAGGTAVAAPRTVRDLLFTPGGDTPAGLGHRLWSADEGPRLERVLAALPPESRTAVVQATGTQAAGILGLDLAELLVSGWRTHHDLAAAACRTLASAATEVVALPPHEITAAQQPSVTVLADQQPIAVFRLALSVRLQVHGLVAEIRSGRLVAVHAGQIVSRVTLTAQGTAVAQQSWTFAIPEVVPAGSGIRLLPAREYRLSAGTTLGGLPTASTAAGSPAGSRTAPIAG